MNRIAAIARKEFFHIFRDPRIIMSVFGLPLIQLVLFAYALNYDVRNIPTAVADEDRSVMSRQFIDSFQSTGYFRVDKIVGSAEEIDEALTSGADKVVLRIPPGFGDRIRRGETAPVQILIDGTESNSAQTASGYSAAISQFHSSGLIKSYLQARGLPASAEVEPIRVRTRVWYNPDLRTVNFLLPGLIAIIMMNITIVQTAMSLVREKEYGTIEQLIASPVKRYELMVGKIGPYLGVAVIDIVAITLIGLFLFDVPFRGSIVLMGVASALFVFGSLGLGLIISTISGSLQTAQQLAQFISLLPGFMLSGFFFPIRNMPRVLQLASYLVPARYYLTILRGIFLKGAGLGLLMPDLVALVIYSLVTVTVAAVVFKKKM
ncbi:MAG: ABC transporter permease [Actinobacteria bacterium]|nr:MAG: ABC transporter permease [Actinomycetota bacterium]